MSAARPEVTGRAPVLGVTVREACRVTGLSRSTIWKLISQKVLESTSVGRTRIVLYRSLQDLLEGRNEKARGVASAPGRTKHQGNVHEQATPTADGGDL
jgi:excisionase family DNA binding protein